MFRSSTESAGFRSARFRARRSRHDSISARMSLSTLTVPFFPFVEATKRSNEPWRIRLLREDIDQVVPLLRQLPVREVLEPGRRRRIARRRLLGAVVDRPLLEVRQDVQRQPRVPGVAAELERARRVVPDVNSRLLVSTMNFRTPPMRNE